MVVLPKVTAKRFVLNTGDEIPAIGLGTWQSPPDQVRKAVAVALQHGYRHLDTARAYKNEKEVGDGIRDSGVPRQEIWITTKLANTDHKRVAEALEESLQFLGTDYIDLYLIHWPCSTDPGDTTKMYQDWDFVDTWGEMQKLVGSGKVRNIGVSNFGITQLERLLGHPTTTIVPAVNQIELHPYRPSPKLVKYNSGKGIHSTGYSCLGSTNSLLYSDPVLLELSAQRGRTPQQIMLAWGIQKGWSVLPKSVTPERIRKNFDLDGWSLSADEIKVIDSLTGRMKVCDGAFLPRGAKVFYGDDE
ncbi:hypothetical protein G647_01686 [Cladophialophora carrionii CBS 160.54]|uniref:D-xylose reductase [NAD(P)H] n=1 Tax=Cladophialophora carrionii CBS 160.54 TaxID=1279043 RepID=V9DSC6_9EURO|nr:uncharacterized protein G647_01686 [Cladophialophora carrionii CBS 160.54]ETI29233.1 hypothetical protein G647_01686 [Cladophialophora carrionii CBS 160.54]